MTYMYRAGRLTFIFIRLSNWTDALGYNIDQNIITGLSSSLLLPVFDTNDFVQQLSIQILHRPNFHARTN